MPLAVGDSKRMLGILVLLWMLQGVQAQVIIHPPVDIAVFVNQSAVFECETSGGGLQEWRVNGTLYQYLPSDVREDMRTSRVDNTNKLTIVARTKYNGTTVQCLIIVGIGGNIIAESRSAELHIKEPDTAPTGADTVPPTSEIEENATTTSHMTTETTTPETTTDPETTDPETAVPSTTETAVPSTTVPDLDQNSEEEGPSQTTIIVIAVLSSIALIVIVVVLILTCIYRLKKRNRRRKSSGSTLDNIELGVTKQEGVASTKYAIIPDAVPTSNNEIVAESEDDESQHEETFATTPTGSTESGDDSRIVVNSKTTRQPPLPRSEERGSKAVMSASIEISSAATVSFNPCDDHSIKNVDIVTDIEAENSVASTSSPEEEERDGDGDGDGEISREETDVDSDGSVLLLNGRTSSVENVPQLSGHYFPAPALSHSYNIDVRSSGVTDEPAVHPERSDNGVSQVIDHEHTPVLVTLNSVVTDKIIEGGQKISTDAIPPAANRDSGEVAHSSAEKHTSTSYKDIQSDTAVEGIPPAEGPVQLPPSTKPLRMKPLGAHHHLPVGKGGGLQLPKKKSPPQQRRQHKKRSKPKPAIPQAVGPSAVPEKAPDPVEEERERSSLSSSPAAVD